MRFERLALPALLSGLCPSVLQAAEPQNLAAKEPQVLAEVRKMIRERSWSEACAYTRDFLHTLKAGGESLPPGSPLETLNRGMTSSQQFLYGELYESVGLYNEAIRYDLCPLDGGAYGTDLTFSVSAWGAPLAAARAGKWEDAARYYRFLERNAAGWQRDMAKKRADAIEAFLKSPGDLDARIEFVNRFWIGSSLGEGLFWRDAARMLEEILATSPPAAQQKKILQLLVHYAREEKEWNRVDAWSRLALQRFPDDADFAAEIQLALGADAFARNDLPAALDTFRRVAADYRKARCWADVQYNIGFVLMKQKEFADAIPEFAALLRERARNDAPTNDIMSPFKNYQHNACANISRCCEELLDFGKALEYENKAHDEFPFVSFCGTCAMDEKARHQGRVKLLETLASAAKRGKGAIAETAIRLYWESGSVCAPALRIAPQEAVPCLLQRIANGRKEECTAALNALREVGVPDDQMPAFESAFATANDEVKYLLLYLLQDVGQAKPTCMSFLHSLFEQQAALPGNSRMIEVVESALVQTSRANPDTLTPLLAHPNPDVRERARDIFRNHHDIGRAAIQPIVRFLPKCEPAEQRRIVNLLCHVPPAASDAPLIIKIVQEGGERLEVRKELLEMLDGLGGQAGTENLDWQGVLNVTKLMAAVERRDISEITRLAREKSAEVNAADYRGDTALIRAVRKAGWEDTDVPSILVKNGANLNAQNSLGKTVLMEAVTHYKPALVWFLLGKGADPNLRALGGATALSLATEAGYYRIVSLLLRPGLDAGVNLRNGTNVLMWSCQRSRADLVKRALELGIDVNATDGEGKTALIWAVKADGTGVDIPKVLLERGADKVKTDHSGKTARDYATGAALSVLLSPN